MEALRSSVLLHCCSGGGGGGSKQSLPAAAKLRLAPPTISASGPCLLHKRISQASQAAFALFFTEIAAKSPAPALALDIVGGAASIDEASAFGPSDGIDVNVIESVLGFASENPAAVVGGLLALAVPLIVSRILLGKPQPWGTVSAKEAYEKLASKDPASQILDIREPGDIKIEGTPDLRQFKKRVLQISFAQDEAAFVTKVKRKFKDSANTTLFILDRFDGNSIAAAKLLTNNGFKEAYAIKDGAEGGRGWQQSGLPWLVPKKGLAVNLDFLKEAFQFENDVVPTSLGVAAAAGVGLVVFSEAETALQLLGTVALLQLFAKKFLFAEDRKRTLTQIRTFLDTKVAPKELVEEIKGVGKALLPKFEEVADAAGGPNGALVSTEPEPEEPAASVPSVEVEASEEVKAPEETKAEEGPAEAPAAAAAVDSSEEIEKPASSRPLSPYFLYPDLKPPSSPSPSRP